jgi:hypothetical protein
MTKYDSVSRRTPEKKARQTHPVWRGIGCIFTILIPVISYIGSYLTINLGVDRNWPIPYQLLGYPRLPALIYKSNALAALLQPITTLNNLYAIVILALFYMLILGGLLAFVDALVYSFAGPPRWGPQDVPPPKFRTRRYKR